MTTAVLMLMLKVFSKHFCPPWYFRFNNGPCVTGTRNGTCYTEEECMARSGTNTGTTCASGYGICCACKKTIRLAILTLNHL